MRRSPVSLLPGCGFNAIVAIHRPGFAARGHDLSVGKLAEVDWRHQAFAHKQVAQRRSIAYRVSPTYRALPLFDVSGYPPELTVASTNTQSLTTGGVGVELRENVDTIIPFVPIENIALEIL
jgi:hypothetical protein